MKSGNRNQAHLNEGSKLPISKETNHSLKTKNEIKTSHQCKKQKTTQNYILQSIKSFESPTIFTNLDDSHNHKQLLNNIEKSPPESRIKGSNIAYEFNYEPRARSESRSSSSSRSSSIVRSAANSPGASFNLNSSL
jgi:hypothetical protein